MKKAIPWILLLFVVFLAVCWIIRTDIRTAEIVATSKADVKEAQEKVAVIQTRLDESGRRYVDIEGEVERLEAELSVSNSLLQIKPKTRTVIKTVKIPVVAVPASSAPAAASPPDETFSLHNETILTNGETFLLSTDWEAAYYEYVAKNQDYIAANQALRAEHEKMMAYHEGIHLEDQKTIAGLIETRDKLAALRSPRFVAVIGVGGGIGADGEIHTGFQFTIGIRVDNLFLKKYKRN